MSQPQRNDYKFAQQFLLDQFSRMPTRTHNPDIVEYASTTIIPTGPYRGLKFSHDRAPYLREIMECLSPSSTYKEIAVMFPAQSGKTFTADTLAMYYIEAVPSEILYATSDETMAIKWLEREIVPRAANAGIIFKSEIESRSSRRTGDTSYSKTFPGGVIDIASALSPSQLASATKRIVLGDETDRWKIKLGEQGSVINQLRARTQAWKNQAKIFWFSTPTTEDLSVIYQLYLKGDCRLYFIPCPYCGTMQLMDFSSGKSAGLHWEYKKGHIVKTSIELICESPTCGKGIKESSKPRMLRGGEWRPTSIAEQEYMASFTINGLYSFQLAWYDMVVAYDEAQKSIIAKQDFEQLKMGRPFKEIGMRPKAEKIMQNRGTYKSGTVPKGVLYLTMGVDVQEGSDGDPNNPARLEAEILGIGAGYRTWSIEYKVFKGDIKDSHGGAWEKMHQWALQTGLTYYRREDDFAFPVNLVFIDSGDGNVSDIVYQFCSRWQNTFPIKGRSVLKRKVKDKAESDEIFQGNMQRYRSSKLDEDVFIYLINTNYYKTQIYHNLNIARQEADPQRAGFCYFPADYSDWYFTMLTNEEKRIDGSFTSGGRRNESLDTRVYALCAGDVFLDSELLNYRAWAKQQKFPFKAWGLNFRSIADIQQIEKPVILLEMEKQTAIKPKKIT